MPRFRLLRSGQTVVANSPRGTTALVTGSAGFLGSHLCDRLLEDGPAVICIDNLLTGETRNIDHLNTYGPRMRFDDGRVLPTFMSQALQDEPLTVYGDGSQTRSFCYVDGLTEGIDRVVRLGRDPDSGAVPLFNLGSPDEVTILQLASEVIEVTGSRSRIVFEPLPTDDPTTRRPDITRAKQVLGWKPKVSRQEGLQNMVPYLRSALASTV